MSLFAAYFESVGTKQVEAAIQETGGFLWSGLSQQVDADAAVVAAAQENPKPMQKFLDAGRVTREITTKLKPELDWLKLKRRCIYCNETYMRSANIGNLRCRWHPYPGFSARKYDCCGRKKDPFRHTGCIACDHTPNYDENGRWHAGNRYEAIPLSIAVMLRIPQTSYIIADSEDLRNVKAIVKRCEK